MPTITSIKDTTPTTIPLLINNKPHHTTTTFPVHNPATNTLIHNCSSASLADVSLALTSSQIAFPSWRALPPSQKRDIFLRAASLFKSRTQELCIALVTETGASSAWASFNLNLAREILIDVSGRISSLEGSIPTPSDPSTHALILKEPYGTILAIAPWNAAYILGIRSVAYALAAGNTVILKAPELSPLCSYLIVSILHDAGLPPGVLNLLAHQPQDAAEVTRSLIESPIIKKVNFTGSTAVGRIIAEICGRNLKPVLLELGGKAPAIVWEDADLKLAARECAMGALLHGGQICMSTERILVHENIATQFEEALKLAVEEFFPRNEESGIHTLINAQAVQKNRKLLRDAISKGAILIHGDPEKGEGAKMRPVIVKGVKRNMDLYHTESFGPTVSLITVKSEEEALGIANDTEYGLSAAVFTADLARGLRFARGVESGAVHINKMTVHDETALPHGGMKASGYGRFGAIGLEEWVRTKTVTFKG